MDNCIDIKNFSASYGNDAILSALSVSIERNKITALIGPSGCGKTTFLKCINRTFDEEKSAVVSGDIIFEGNSIYKANIENIRRKIGLVAQTPAPFPFSIYKNMVYAPKYYGIRDKDKLNSIVLENLKLADLYDEIHGDVKKNAMALSGGQKQRLCIARALTSEPLVLLLDEPCSALDVKSTSNIENMLIKLKEKYTIVIVTHNIFQAQRIADNVIFMNNGKIIETDTAENIFKNPKEKETKDFLSGVFG